MNYKAEKYDPSWLVELAKKEYPEDSWLYEALRQCNIKLLISDDPAMIYFVDPKNSNQPGSKWIHDECIELESYEKGSIIIDILKNRKIGAVELIWLIKE